MPYKKVVRKKPGTVQGMFNAIAPRYDILNHLLSFGMDIIWRKKAITMIDEKTDGTILDIAAGSGDLTLAAKAVNPRLIVASDFAASMFDIFQKKIKGKNDNGVIQFTACDALFLPFRPKSFDAVMVAFGVRNFADRLGALCEMKRVLKPGGIVLILELTYPRAPVINQLYSLYARFFMPLFGRIISRHAVAYSYLQNSIEDFPENEKFASLLTEAGFHRVQIHKLTFGTATIFTGRS